MSQEHQIFADCGKATRILFDLFYIVGHDSRTDSSEVKTSTGYNIAVKWQPVSGDDPEMNLDPGREKGPVFECQTQLWI